MTSATWAPTRMSGLSAVIGSWNTIDMARPRRSFSFDSGTPIRSRSCRRAFPPAVTPSGRRPMSDSAGRALPEPDSPMRPTRSPGPIWNDTSCTSSTAPARTVSPSTLSTDPPELGVEVVAQAVAEQVEAEHGQRDGQAGPEGQARRGEQQLLRLLQHAAPRRRRRAGAEAEEGQRRLRQDG